MKILRISNSSGYTSAPLNSFTLARNRYLEDEETTFLAYDRNENTPSIATGGSSISFEQANKNPLKFLTKVRQWFKYTKKNNSRALIHIHQPGAGFVFTLLCKIACRGIPIVYTVHNNYANYRLRHKIFLSFCFFVSDRVTFVSKDAMNSFSGKLVRPAEKKSLAIQNGVDVERIDQALLHLPDRSKEDLKTLCIMNIGRLIHQKNQRFLLDVLEALNEDWMLEVYGDGPLLDKLQQEAAKKGLSSNVLFKGIVPRDQVFQAIANSDIFVSPSLWEGLPVALMEAMCVGVPCIVSDIPSHREVGEETEGVLLTSMDVKAWQNQLEHLSGLNRQQRFALGRQNRKIIERHFSVRRMQERYREVYEELL